MYVQATCPKTTEIRLTVPNLRILGIKFVVSFVAFEKIGVQDLTNVKQFIKNNYNYIASPKERFLKTRKRLQVQSIS